MRIDFVELIGAADYEAVKRWALGKGLPAPWMMQVHPNKYPGLKEVEWRIVFDMGDRVEFIRPQDWVALTADGKIHGIDWLDVEKNYPLQAFP